MIRKLLLACLLIASIQLSFAQLNIPDNIEYCGQNLKLTPAAKAKLKAYVDAIYESPRFFNTMAQKADTYMPFIEEAFADANLPDDLKYLVIQESSLKADATSDSDAVGYWQFKLDAAQEYGLQVNEYVDERQHIFRASEAAAQYFHKANYDFDNWVYAVIAYYEGLTGAVRYTDPTFYSKQEMVVTEKLHWYAMKAIAHKLAYEVALGLNEDPRVWLEPVASDGEMQIEELCKQHGMPKELFIEYNKWAVNQTVLAEGSNHTYYVPHFSEPYPGHQKDPVKLAKMAIAQEQHQADPVEETQANNQKDSIPPKEIIEPQITDNQTTTTQDSTPKEVTPPPASKPKRALRGEAKDVAEQPDLDYALFYAKADLNHGQDFVVYEEDMSLGEIARTYKVPLGKLASWNKIRGGKLPKTGSFLYLARPDKAAFHIVRAGETLNQIAAFHKTSVKALYKKNRYSKGQRDIFVGQKLYLASKKPKGEKIIILRIENPFEEKEEEPIILSPPPLREEKPVKPVEGTTQQGQDVQPQQSEGENSSSQQADAQHTAEVPGVQQQEQDVQTQEKPFDGPKTRWVNHTVSGGETLWSISVTYGTKVEIIKLINKLPNEDLSEGMVLRILAKEEKLKELGIE